MNLFSLANSKIEEEKRKKKHSSHCKGLYGVGPSPPKKKQKRVFSQVDTQCGIEREKKKELTGAGTSIGISLGVL